MTVPRILLSSFGLALHIYKSDMVWMYISHTGKSRYFTPFFFKLRVDNGPVVIHYAKKMSLHVALQKSQGDGHIFPPYLEITYEAAAIKDYDNNVEVSI